MLYYNYIVIIIVIVCSGSEKKIYQQLSISLGITSVSNDKFIVSTKTFKEIRKTPITTHDLLSIWLYLLILKRMYKRNVT